MTIGGFIPPFGLAPLIAKALEKLFKGEYKEHEGGFIPPVGLAPLIAKALEKVFKGEYKAHEGGFLAPFGLAPLIAKALETVFKDEYKEHEGGFIPPVGLAPLIAKALEKVFREQQTHEDGFLPSIGFPSLLAKALEKLFREEEAKGRAAGSGFLNSLISSLPVKLHMPGYSYLGPGTYLNTKLPLSHIPKNKLDALALEHDKAYHHNKTVESRKLADDKLIDGAWERVKAPDSSLGEKTAAWITTNTMKLKRATGGGTYEYTRKLGKDWENTGGSSAPAGLFVSQRTGSHSAGISCTTHELFCP